MGTRMNKLMRNQNLLMRLRKMMRMRKMMTRMRMRMKKKKKRREMEKMNYNHYEPHLFSVKILRVLPPPVILIIGIMIPEYYLICSLPSNQHSDLVIADLNKAPLIYIFVCLCECFSCKLFVKNKQK